MTNTLAAEISVHGDVPGIEQASFVYGDEVISYEVLRKAITSDGKSKSAKSPKIQIKVQPDQRVLVTVPVDADQGAIHKALLKRARWIWQNIQDFAAQQEHVCAKRYVSGESQFYLGKRYLLKVQRDDSQLSGAKLVRGQLLVTIKSNVADAQKAVKDIVDHWYQDKAKYHFYQRMAALLPKADWVTGIPRFRMMPMKKQWGSCSTQGNLMLNPHLIKAPKACIDYVILHELCHIAEYNHSDKFWRLMTQVMPDWQEAKAKLDAMAEFYLNE